MASSIQPNFAASRTRHCSRVTVRYHGIAPAAVAVIGAELIGGDILQSHVRKPSKGLA
jgi:hypothetical protein